MQQVIDQILNYLRGMWQRRWIGLAVAWLAAIIGAVVVFRLPDQYEASARVYVDTQSMLRPLMAGMTVMPDAGQQTAILSRTLLSRPNVERIIRKSDLDTSARTTAESLVDYAQSQLRISRAYGDNLYTIAFRYTDGKKARDVVQAALSIFIEQSLGESRSGGDSARKFLDEQIKDYDQKLREAESRQQAFRLKYMGLLSASGKDFVGQMAQVGEQIKDAQIEVRVAQETRDDIKQRLEDEMKAQPAAKIAENTTITVPELDARIEGLKSKIDEALRNYTELHPDVISAKRTLARLEEERTREIAVRRRAMANRPEVAIVGNPIAQQLKVALNEATQQVTTAKARVAEFESRYARLKASAEQLPQIDTELTQLNRDYEIQRNQYASLVSRRETASLTGKLEDAGVAEFRIIDPPRMTPYPVAPNRMALLWGMVAASLAAGVAMSFGVSQVRPTFHDGRVLREVAGRPLLGMVSMIAGPELRAKRRRAALLFAGGMGGLLASYGVAFAVTMLALYKI